LLRSARHDPDLFPTADVTGADVRRQEPALLNVNLTREFSEETQRRRVIRRSA
jgi:hypothetical protein